MTGATPAATASSALGGGAGTVCEVIVSGELGFIGANATPGVEGRATSGFAAAIRDEDVGGLNGCAGVGGESCACVTGFAGAGGAAIAGKRGLDGSGGRAGTFGTEAGIFRGSGSGATRVDSPGPGAVCATPDGGSALNVSFMPEGAGGRSVSLGAGVPASGEGGLPALAPDGVKGMG